MTTALAASSRLPRSQVLRGQYDDEEAGLRALRLGPARLRFPVSWKGHYFRCAFYRATASAGGCSSGYRTKHFFMVSTESAVAIRRERMSSDASSSSCG
jgi:hypothetical protein